MPPPAPAAILFLHDNVHLVPRLRATHHWLAAETGLRSYVVNWRNVLVEPSRTRVWGGYEALDGAATRPLRRLEQIEPRVVVHRIFVDDAAERLLSALAVAHPTAAISYHPFWRSLNDKWVCETCFLAASDDILVIRPRTYLVANGQLRSLAAVGRSVPLIFKPARGTMCRGIVLTVPSTFDEVARRLGGRRSGRYVTQEIVRPPLLYRGSRFDLRIYVLVLSWSPLRFRLYREGVVRMAARGFESDTDDAARVLTGNSFRKRERLPIANARISDLLADLERRGYRVGDLWPRLELLCEHVLLALARHAPFSQEIDVSHRFYLSGFDVILSARGDEIEPLFLETNDYPQLNGWGEAVDASLRAVHRQWLHDLVAGDATRDGAVTAP